MPEIPEVVSLIRFSTAEQVAQGKAGVEGQRRINELAAKNHGLRIRDEFVVINVSGRHTASDPQFNAMFKALEDPTLVGILANEQSRIERPEDFGSWQILARIQKLKKVIFTPTGRIDPNTPEGRMALTLGGFMSGEELHLLKSRFARGKMIKRLEGKHAGGNQTLPRGFKFIRERNEIGKVVGCHWEQDPVEMLRMQTAFQLLMTNLPFQLIAQKTGGYGSGTAIKRAMMNPCWIGCRRYEFEATGDEYHPEPTVKNPAPKPRRRLVRRAVPLDVPSIEDLRTGASSPLFRPIMDLASWDAAQANIAAREGIIRKTRVKNLNKPRFLAMGLLFCRCGRQMYFRYGSDGRSHLDRYYCSSAYPHGPGCGAPSVRRVELDSAIESLVSKRLLDANFLSQILETVTTQPKTPDPVRAAITKARADLEAGRKDLLQMVRHHEISRAEFNQQIALLEKELRTNEALLPAPPPTWDAKEFLQKVANAFACFCRLPFERKRGILNSAVRRIVTDSRSRSLISITISGGYLGRANEQLPLKTQLTIRPVPDLVFHLPEPFEIPDTYVDRRGGNGQHPNQIANRFRGRIQ